MLVPAKTSGLSPFSSSAASTPICANPFRPPPPSTRATFGRDSGVRLRRGWGIGLIRVDVRLNIVQAVIDYWYSDSGFSYFYLAIHKELTQ